MKKFNIWCALWRSKNKLDGKREWIIRKSGIPMLFMTRWEARLWIHENYGYLKDRKDLRSEPHGWKMPIAVKVKVVLQK